MDDEEEEGPAGDVGIWRAVKNDAGVVAVVVVAVVAVVRGPPKTGPQRSLPQKKGRRIRRNSKGATNKKTAAAAAVAVTVPQLLPPNVAFALAVAVVVVVGPRTRLVDDGQVGEGC